MKLYLCLFSILLFLQSCATHSHGSLIQKEAASPHSLAISTSEPLASKAAADIYKAGGNIADAAVAASFAISVVKPQATGIGGGGFLLYHLAKSSKTIAFDFREVAPLRATENMYLKNGKLVEGLSAMGAKAAAVPGLVAGLYDFHKKYGKLSWKKVLQPSIVIAESPVLVSADLERKLIHQKKNILATPALEKMFTKDGRLLKEGEFFLNTDLAKTLRMIAAFGKDYFYKGEFAKLVSRWMRNNKGLISEKDFASYKVVQRKPLQENWRDFRIVSFPPPSSGGIHLIQILKIFDQISDPFIQKNGKTVAEIEAMKRAFADRARWTGDPDFAKIPVAALLNENYLKKRALEISENPILPSTQIQAFSSQDKDHYETTHLSFMDGEGNAVSTTQSINFYFGSKVVIPGTGVILNDTMDDFSTQPNARNIFGLVQSKSNRIQPRKRPVSSMTPTIVLDKQGRTQMAIGGVGGPGIISITYYVLSRILRDHQNPETAISDCRFHHQWTPDKLFVEGPCKSEFSYLEKNYTIDNTIPLYFGQVQIAGKDSAGRLYSVVDPRGQGNPLIETQ